MKPKMPFSKSFSPPIFEIAPIPFPRANQKPKKFFVLL